jgi:hypothetical protein
MEFRQVLLILFIIGSVWAYEPLSTTINAWESITLGGLKLTVDMVSTSTASLSVSGYCSDSDFVNIDEPWKACWPGYGLDITLKDTYYFPGSEQPNHAEIEINTFSTDCMGLGDVSGNMMIEVVEDPNETLSLELYGDPSNVVVLGIGETTKIEIPDETWGEYHYNLTYHGPVPVEGQPTHPCANITAIKSFPYPKPESLYESTSFRLHEGDVLNHEGCNLTVEVIGSDTVSLTEDTTLECHRNDFYQQGLHQINCCYLRNLKVGEIHYVTAESPDNWVDITISDSETKKMCGHQESGFIDLDIESQFIYKDNVTYSVDGLNGSLTTAYQDHTGFSVGGADYTLYYNDAYLEDSIVCANITVAKDVGFNVISPEPEEPAPEPEPEPEPEQPSGTYIYEGDSINIGALTITASTIGSSVVALTLSGSCSDSDFVSFGDTWEVCNMLIKVTKISYIDADNPNNFVELDIDTSGTIEPEPEEPEAEPEEPEPQPEEKKFECETGCATSEEACVPAGTRMTVGVAELYCGTDEGWHVQKRLGEKCDNSYECATNFCTNRECYNIAEEMKETRGLLQMIIDFLMRLFGLA